MLKRIPKTAIFGLLMGRCSLFCKTNSTLSKNRYYSCKNKCRFSLNIKFLQHYCSLSRQVKVSFAAKMALSLVSYIPVGKTFAAGAQ